MSYGHEKRSFAISLTGHSLIFVALTVSAYFSKPPPVFENTNKHDVISAVILGDTPDSKIIPQKLEKTQPPPPPEPVKVVEKEVVNPVKQQVEQATTKKDAIALKPVAKEKPQPKSKSKVDEAVKKGVVTQAKKKKNHKTSLAEKKKRKREKQKELARKFEKELQLQAERTMRQQLLEEELRIQGERARFAQGEVNKYKSLIIQAISENWIIPTQSDRRLTSELMIRLSPGGMVLDVQVTQSSGDPALDSSARAAVIKASPLPVPKDPEAFKAFKRFVLKVKPENVV